MGSSIRVPNRSIIIPVNRRRPINGNSRNWRDRAQGLIVPISQINQTLPRKRISFVGQRSHRHGTLLTKFFIHANPEENNIRLATSNVGHREGLLKSPMARVEQLKFVDNCGSGCHQCWL
jgi:hypothetical protein